MKPSLQVRLSQHLALTPQLQQSIRLLQLSTLELHQEVEQMLAAGQPTSPTRIDQELATNPFLRPNSPHIRQRLGMVGEPDWKVFGEIRERKNRA